LTHEGIEYLKIWPWRFTHGKKDSGSLNFRKLDNDDNDDDDDDKEN
jgi:hypothetical protein